ncbi:DUF7350 domain-containing protein [Natronorubrum halophilum]|uniref:DUF7350 domain-containing protein n=1 Tax=Natronorubrum halophilum TaxID=1702106 RepID=UPI0010C20D32|nr:twin-arginine translocation signal domain-containing protein [Natronorubrum halophilum]
MHEHDPDRRTFLKRTGVATGALALAGCLGDDGEDEDEDSEENVDDLPGFPMVENPPAAVYLPTHRESMRMLEPIEAGDYTLAPMLSYPHPFWLVGGSGSEDEAERVVPEQSRGVHMMVTLWDDETGIVLPVDSGAVIRVSLDGEQVGSPASPWAMISQQMGFHFGDNVPLEGDGTYAIEVELPPLPARTAGELEGRFTDAETATFEFDYDESFREAVTQGVEYLDEEEWGKLDALEPMTHSEHDGDDRGDGDSGHDDDGGEHGDDDHGQAAIPYSALPSADAYPGTHLESTDDSDTDLPRSGDAAFLVTLFESGSRLADGDDRYLLVSPRTPYNRVPLADMTMNATVERDGETVAGADETILEQTIDSEYDLHYGASLPDVRPGDAVTIAIESPPQVARHQGYETAFLEMPPLELTVPEHE